jgi:hyperosmotically inducible protein
MQFRTIAAWLLAALLFAPAARAQDVARDARLATDVIRSLDTYDRFTIFDDVNVLVEGGAVTLSGKVTAPVKKDEIGRRVAAVSGVRTTANHLEVLPVSPFDDQLRQRISRAIYGNPSFWPYASMSRPPIHIIVERGHVTLTGVVQSDVERRLARSLATGNGELSVTCRLKTDAEARSE